MQQHKHKQYLPGAACDAAHPMVIMHSAGILAIMHSASHLVHAPKPGKLYNGNAQCADMRLVQSNLAYNVVNLHAMLLTSEENFHS
jgi:hypothetical protein